MNADKMVDLVKNDRLKQKWNTAISCTLTRSVYAQLIRDCYYVSEFRIEKPPTAKDEDAIVNGERVQISRAKRKAFLAALNHYMGETI